MIIKRRDYLYLFLCIFCVCVFVLIVNHELLKNPRFNSINYPIRNVEYEKLNGGEHDADYNQNELSEQTESSSDILTDESTDDSLEITTDGSLEITTDGSLEITTDGSLGIKTDGSLGIKTDGSLGKKPEGSLEITTDEPLDITTVEEESYEVKPQEFTPTKKLMKDKSIKPSNVSLPKSKINRVVDDYYESIKSDLEMIKFGDNQSYIQHMPRFGGRSTKIVIMTSWRSGSTFLGELITSLPGNFYHYEPLFIFGSGRIRGWTGLAMHHLYKLFGCDYTSLTRYISFLQKYHVPFEHNLKLWGVCKDNMDICFNTTFLNKFCSVFPIQTMKIIRLNLYKAATLLSDKTLNLKVIFLLRDPRGSYHSRIQRYWCVGQPECENLSYLCNDLVADFKAAVLLNKFYPDNFRVIRYEELSSDPYGLTKDLFDFLELSMHPKVVEFLDTHTKYDITADNPQTTFRNSKITPYKWRKTMNSSMLHMIEDRCSEAMRLWGYVKLENNSALNNSDLIRDFSLNNLNGTR